jgi:hypothetical protein
VFKTSSPPFGESQIGLVHFGKKTSDKPDKSANIGKIRYQINQLNRDNIGKNLDKKNFCHPEFISGSRWGCRNKFGITFNAHVILSSESEGETLLGVSE